MEAIIRFVTLLNGYGDGSGYGSGSGNGNGFGYGNGNGSCYGYGDSSGDGNGNGFGYGYGDGSGYDFGYGDGDGYGYGSGYGYGDGSGYGSGYGDSSGNGSGDGSGDGNGILSYNNHKVYIIDGLQTLIYSLKGNIAKGAIVNDDMTLKDCYIARVDNCFAHGSTAKEALKEATAKALQQTPIEVRIERFINKFNLTKKHTASDLFEWHGILTGSCKLGRKSFCANHSIDTATAKFTVKEFIALTENQYGREVIKQLKATLKL